MAAVQSAFYALSHRFQSLLSWISRFGEWGFAELFCAEVGFNPCCLGLAVLAAPMGWTATDTGSFNPCCLGLAVLARTAAPPLISIQSFNPCCLGLAVLAIVYNDYCLALGEVSILVVLD